MTQDVPHVVTSVDFVVLSQVSLNSGSFTLKSITCFQAHSSNAILFPGLGFYSRALLYSISWWVNLR